jgi:hypothetical protein
MTSGGGLSENWALQLQCANDPTDTQVEVGTNDVRKLGVSESSVK